MQKKATSRTTKTFPKRRQREYRAKRKRNQTKHVLVKDVPRTHKDGISRTGPLQLEAGSVVPLLDLSPFVLKARSQAFESLFCLTINSVELTP